MEDWEGAATPAGMHPPPPPVVAVAPPLRHAAALGRVETPAASGPAKGWHAATGRQADAGWTGRDASGVRPGRPGRPAWRTSSAPAQPSRERGRPPLLEQDVQPSTALRHSTCPNHLSARQHAPPSWPSPPTSRASPTVRALRSPSLLPCGMLQPLNGSRRQRRQVRPRAGTPPPEGRPGPGGRAETPTASCPADPAGLPGGHHPPPRSLRGSDGARPSSSRTSDPPQPHAPAPAHTTSAPASTPLRPSRPAGVGGRPNPEHPTSSTFFLAPLSPHASHWHASHRPTLEPR